MRYSIDTNTLIDCWRRRYPPDVFPGIWSNLVSLIQSGELRATEVVLFELEQVEDKSDSLLQWAYAHRELFVPLDREIQVLVSLILRDHPTFVDNKKTRNEADQFVVALAKMNRCAVVTGETPTGNPHQRMKIPDACKALNIPVLNLLQLFRERGWKL